MCLKTVLDLCHPAITYGENVVFDLLNPDPTMSAWKGNGSILFVYHMKWCMGYGTVYLLLYLRDLLHRS